MDNETKDLAMPKGWSVTMLRSVCHKTSLWNPEREKRDRFRYIDVSSVSNDRFCVTEAQEISAASAPSRARKIVKRGDVIYATVRPSLKRVAWLDSEFDDQIASTAFCVVRADCKQAVSQFLYFLLLSDDVNRKIIKHEHGASYPAVTDKDVLNQEIPLPPLPEQQRIAAVLWKIQKAVEIEDAIVRNARDLKKSLLRRLFTRGLRGEPQKETEIGPIPESWDIVCVESAVTAFRFSRERQIPASHYKATGKFPIIDQGQEVVAGYTDDENKIFDLAHPLIIFGDHTRAMKFVDFPFALGADGTKPLIASPGFDPLYLFFALCFLEIPSRGYNRHFKFLAESLIPKPATEEEQQKIARILQTVDRKIEAHESKKRSLQDLFKTMLHKLMTAQIRVHNLDIDTSAVETA
ncbi:MAG: restriction endonuclease subunit S [Verrucomicrobia bacterium]|nr:restriction endonuclease subunit S [Verrucomicrobiota bacterium]